mmetsp:Transcript_9750/g.24149  ORF Transcript_9750/g.24149 Transcript_9750/m.24149 type:complete len:216 (+) Transcript_9750:317-964(+)
MLDDVITNELHDVRVLKIRSVSLKRREVLIGDLKLRFLQHPVHPLAGAHRPAWRRRSFRRRRACSDVRWGSSDRPLDRRRRLPKAVADISKPLLHGRRGDLHPFHLAPQLDMQPLAALIAGEGHVCGRRQAVVCGHVVAQQGLQPVRHRIGAVEDVVEVEAARQREGGAQLAVAQREEAADRRAERDARARPAEQHFFRRAARLAAGRLVGGGRF